MKDEKKTKCKNCEWLGYFGDLSIHFCRQCHEVVNKEDFCIISEDNWESKDE